MFDAVQTHFVFQEPKSDLDRAIRNFIVVLSNAQSEVKGKTGTPRAQSRPSACLQTSRDGTREEILHDLRVKRRKLLFVTPSPSIAAAQHKELTFCLLPASTTKTPKNEEGLLQAGLGTRIIAIADNADHEQITGALHEKYPKMKALTGGWLLYKAAGGKGQRNLSVVDLGTEGYTSKILRVATSNGKQRLYIVPLQEEIDTTPLPHDAAEFSKMPKSQCKSCGLTMPLQLLVGHIESCEQASSQRKIDNAKCDGNTTEPCSK